MPCTATMSDHSPKNSRNDKGADNSVDQLCLLLTRSLTALASDASEVRILSHIATSTQDANDDTAANRLRRLDKSITAIEERVQLLADFVHEEKQVLQKVETQHQDAIQHHELLTALQNNLQLKEKQRKSQQQESTGKCLKTPTDHLLQQQQLPRLTKLPRFTTSTSESTSVSNRSEDRGNAIASLHPKPIRKRRDSIDPPDACSLLNLDLVTKDELEAIPRTYRGHIAVSVLNDALRDIAALCLKKKEGGRKGKPPFVLNAIDAATKENTDWFVVGEQELRQSCFFFRTGESTARSVLLILRCLGRLKQVPAKTGDVTYTVVRRTTNCP